MTHVELTGDVGRRNYDGVGSFVGLNLCMEIAAAEPEVINAVFNLFGVVNLFQFFSHLVCFLSKINLGVSE